MWKNTLKRIQEIEGKYGNRLREPATNQELNQIKETIKTQFDSFVLPETYIDFLRVVNGLDFNGLIVYGVDRHFLDAEEHEITEKFPGFVETNKIWHENEWQKQFMFFGDSDTAWYCYDLKKNIFLELDKPSGTEVNIYNEFQAMLEEALTTRLN